MNFSKTIIGWYSVNKRDLPWRKTLNPYHIWLSEIILQQTQVKQGLPYYEAFVAHYPSVFHLASAQESEVLKLWQGLGYYSRARNLHATAQYVAKELNGEFPKSYKGLLKLKGVGDYTASAIASICYNEAVAVVDGNVYRVLSRYFGIDTPINSSKGAKVFKTMAQELLDKRNPAEFNQAVMEFGATQCRPKNPICASCPFQNHCVALRKGKINELPVKNKKAKAKRQYFNFLVFLSEDGKTILQKRHGKGIWQNLYQFPLVETNKDYDAKLFRSLIEDHELVKGQEFTFTPYNKESIVHKLSHRHLYTKFWLINVKKLPVAGVSVDRVRDYAVPILIGNFIESFNF